MQSPSYPILENNMFLRLFSSSIGSNKRFQRRFERKVPFAAENIFDVVADVGKYDTFLPFCTKSRVVKQTGDHSLEADLEIGFRIFTESYRSLVTLERPYMITARATQSYLFKELQSTWKFHQLHETCTEVTFEIDFEVSSSIHAHAVQLFFTDIASRQLQAFERRCKDVNPKSKRQKLSVQGTKKFCHTKETQELEDIEVFIKHRIELLSTHKSIPSTRIVSLNKDEIAILRDCFLSNVSQNQCLTISSFQKCCSELSKRSMLFDAYRTRYVLIACSSNSSFCQRIFKRLNLNSRGELDFPAFALGVFFFTKASPVQQFLAAFRNCVPGQSTAYKDVARLCLSEHFHTRIQALQIVLPEMLIKHARDHNQLQGGVETGIKLLGSVGVLNTVLHQIGEEIEETIESSLSNSASGDHRVNVESIENAMLRKEEVIEVITVSGVSQLIKWADALSTRTSNE